MPEPKPIPVMVLDPKPTPLQITYTGSDIHAGWRSGNETRMKATLGFTSHIRKLAYMAALDTSIFTTPS